MIIKNNFNLFNSFSYQRSLSFDNNIEFDCTNSSKSLEENFLVHGDIYGKTEIKRNISQDILILCFFYYILLYLLKQNSYLKVK